MHTAVAFPLIDNQVFIFNMYLGHREDIVTDNTAGPYGPHVLVQLIQLIQFFPFQLPVGGALLHQIVVFLLGVAAVGPI